MIGWGTVAGYVAGWIDKFIPSKKAASYESLKILEVKYSDALEMGDDTNAAIYRKQMAELRKKLGYADGDI